jgi:Zn-dependent protease
MAIQFSMQDGTLDLGRYHGAPIHLHMTFFVTAVVLASPFWHRFNLAGLLLAVLFAAVIFASILLHEIAHAAVARRYGVPADRIDIHMFGGLVHFRWMPHTRAQDFAITLAGPLSNLALGLAALAIVLLMPRPEPEMITVGGSSLPRYVAPSIAVRLLWATAYLNIGLCVVNLIPAFPLDGGKLLHLVIEERWGPRLATLVVSGLGLVFAGVSTFFLIGTLLAGFPVWAPPEFAINWRAFQAARQGYGGWDVYAH